VFVAIIPVAVSADASTDALKHLNTFTVLIDASDFPCGPTKKDIDTGLRYVLSQSRIKLAEGLGPSSAIYVNVALVDDCSAANVRIEVLANVRITETNQPVYGATIWEDGGGVLSGRSNMRSHILEEVERLTKKLVVDWSSVNP